MKHAIIIFILFASLFQVQGQTEKPKIKWDLSVRYRFESWNEMNAKNYGDNSPAAIGKLNDNTIYQRVITGFTYEPSKKLTIALHLQDSRAFGWSLRNSEYPDLFKI
jgi:hypothetical protein